MTVEGAMQRLSGPLRFGDPQQTRALKFLRDVDEDVESFRDDPDSAIDAMVYLDVTDAEEEALRLYFPRLYQRRLKADR